jgi:hypothetical protein
MTQTLLSDLIIPEVFDKYVLVKTTELSRFRQSGILVDLSAELMPQMGGVTVNMPFFNDLIGTDDVMNDSIDLTVNNVTSGLDVAVKLGRAKAFGASDLAADLSGADPMAVIANRFAAFWVRAEQHILLSAVAGQIGKVTENVLDISSLTGSAANFDPHSFIDACGLLGDHQDMLAGIAVHSDTYKAMKKQDLIDFIKPSTLEEEIPVYQGKFVLVDDTLPKSNGVYDTYIFGPGAIGYATASPRRPVELERRALVGMGSEWLVHRGWLCMHTRGVKWTPQNGVPSRPDLALLPRSQGLSSRAIRNVQSVLGGAVRWHLHAADRFRHARPAAQTTARQQSRVAESAGAARNPAPHQRLGKRHSVSRHQTQGQRQHAQRCRSRLPRWIPGPRQDLQKIGNRLLGLSRLTADDGVGERQIFVPLRGRADEQLGVDAEDVEVERVAFRRDLLVALMVDVVVEE